MEPTYTVAELSRAISRAVDRAFPDEVWVSGEIRNLSRPPSGHVYFSLVDGDDPTPQLPVVLFADDKDAVNRALVRVSAGRMVDGMQVRLRGTVGHQVGRGVVQLRMRWIDTEYTLGRLAAERRAVLEGLAATGLLDRQAGLTLPVAPHRIGLVTSPGSAAHADFLDELGGSGFGFTVLMSPATVQGPAAAASVAAALAALWAHRPEVVALVRGGGAQTDLAAFDTDQVARAVATAPVPVFTGIGHEVDDTVADRVAARSAKTPTACAHLLVGMVRDFAGRLGAAERGVRLVTDRVTVRAGDRLAHRAHRLGAAARWRMSSHAVVVDVARRRLDGATSSAVRAQAVRLSGLAADIAAAGTVVLETARLRSEATRLRLVTAAPRVITAERRRLDALTGLARAHDPQRMLARGWTVTRTENGSLVRSPDRVAVGDRLMTTTAGGAVTSVVDDREPEGGRAR